MQKSGGERCSAVLLSDEELLSSHDRESEFDVVCINIIGDDHLEFDGRSVHIDSAVLALNGLIACRRQGLVSANTLRDSVGYDATPSSLNDDMKKIQTSIESLTGRDDLISVPGTSKGKRYQLSGVIDFSDRRHDAMDDPDLRRLFFDLSNDVPSLEDFQGEWLVFASSEARRRTFSAMLREVSDQPVVQWFSQQIVTREDWPHRLSSETLEENFALTERALAAFLQPDYAHDRYGDILIEGALAFQEVFISTLRRADALSRQMNNFQQGRMSDDLFQAAAEKLMEYVMTFRKSDLDRGALATFFYSRMAKVASGTILHQLEEERWRHVGVSEKKRRLIRRINQANEVLSQELGREPSGPEIADRIKASIDDVEEALYMMERTNVSVDAEYFREAGRRRDIEAGMARVSMGLGELDESIEYLDRRRQVDMIFDSDRIKTRDKIALSVFYGVFVSGLGGRCFEKLSHERSEPFVYPRTQEDFDRVVASVEYSYANTSRLLGFNKGHLSKLIDNTLRISREVLRYENTSQP